MGGQQPRGSGGKPRQRKTTRRSALSQTNAHAEVTAVLGEIQRVLDTPLAELVDLEEERAAAAELAREARAAPAMVRLREVVAFVGHGRPATQAGNLKAPDAIALAARLGTRDDGSGGVVRSMDDLQEAAQVFRWALAAELLAARATKIVPGPWAHELEHDPLAAWFKAATTLLDHGVLDGFRRGWRKSYVELLDASAGPLLAAIEEAGDEAPLTAIDDLVWEMIARAYGYKLEDAFERRHAVRLVMAMMWQLADIGAVICGDDDVVLTGLGNTLASAATAMSNHDDVD
jgi:hypothetical protein